MVTINRRKILVAWTQITKNAGSIFVLSALSGFSAIVFYFITTTSSFVRLYADDFCTSAMLDKLGFWQSQVYWYTEWSGRYSYNLLVHFSEIFRLDSVKVLPIILSIILALSFTWILYQIFAKKLSILVCSIIGFSITSLLIINSPNIYQTLYWQTGSLTYTIPLIFMNLILGLILIIHKDKKHFNIPTLIALFSTAFFAGGFAESYVTLQITLVTLLSILLALFWRKKETIIACAVTLLASLLSITATVLAPGNMIRQAHLPRPLPLFDVVVGTIMGTLQYFHTLSHNRVYMLALLLILLVGFYFVVRTKVKLKAIKLPRTIILVVALMISAITSVGSIYAPVLYALSSNPPARTLFLAQYPVMICALAIGVVMGVYFKQYYKNRSSGLIVGVYSNNFNKTGKVDAARGLACIASACIVGIVLLMINPVINSSTKIYSNVKNYSTVFDARSTDISRQIDSNINDLSISWAPPLGDLPEPRKSKEEWINACMADFYNVGHITANKSGD